MGTGNSVAPSRWVATSYDTSHGAQVRRWSCSTRCARSSICSRRSCRSCRGGLRSTPSTSRSRYSDIPTVRYDASTFTAAVEGYLDRLDLRDVTLAGVSIGGTIALIAAAKRNPRVARVVAINPYDYAQGRGMARSSFFGATSHTAPLPVIGETVMRLRNFIIMKFILLGVLRTRRAFRRRC